MYAIKHVIGIMEFSDSNMYVEEGAECIEIPDSIYPKPNHFYDIQDGKLVEMDLGISSNREDLG